MNGRIIRSELALADLAEQSEYIRQHNPQAALRFLAAVEDTFRRLASLPGIGERFETSNPVFHDLRCFSISQFPPFVVYYRPLADGIIVIRVIRGTRDVDRIFGWENE
jgi:toxin ParE1/3/4